MNRLVRMLPVALLAAVAGTAPPQDEKTEYAGRVLPLLEKYCIDCHSAESKKGELDLERFASLADIRKDTRPWPLVVENLENGEMPPKKKKQPTPDERTLLVRWVRSMLETEARARAGDPGRVILRRLSNAEYTYSLRDLTGVRALDPAREFPVDGAAGEGFTNTGSALVMSPSLVEKYLEAAKEVSRHVEFLPDGIRFSPHTTRRDRTDVMLARIQEFYGRFTDERRGTAVNLQGIKFDTNKGGKLPLDRYLAALLVERDSLRTGKKTIQSLADGRALSPKYLQKLWRTLEGKADGDSLLLDDLRSRWNAAPSDGGAALAADIVQWQKLQWKFNSIGQIGKAGGPKAWMEPVSPLRTEHEFNLKLPAGKNDVIYYLTAAAPGERREKRFAVWKRPRIEKKGRPPILLRDVKALQGRVQSGIALEQARAGRYLEAVAELRTSSPPLEELARSRGLNARVLEKWTQLLALGERARREITGHFTRKVTRVQGYADVNGWGLPATPSLLTNRSDQPISFLTLTVPARGVTVHPSPTLESIVSWRSPMDLRLRVEGRVVDADNKCGNGAAWRVEILSASGIGSLAKGTIDNGRDARFRPDADLDIRKGDIVSLIVNARDRNHVCDTTHVELRLSEVGGKKRVWDLAADIVDNVLKGNPLADSYGNEGTWHFCAAKERASARSALPPGSTLARWRAAVVAQKPAAEIDRLTRQVGEALAGKARTLSDPDKMLKAHLEDWNGPMNWLRTIPSDAADDASEDLRVEVPSVTEIRLPGHLVAGGEFVATAALAAGTDGAQFRISTSKPEDPVSLRPGPIVAAGDLRARLETSMAEFGNLFPPALCYARIVPVDEVVTLTLFHREDGLLRRLMLSDAQTAELDRLWDELIYISHEPLKLVVAFEQIKEFATQDRPDLVVAFKPLEEPIHGRAAAFRRRLVDTEPAHVKGVIGFASRAWRRPLTGAEELGLRDFYRALRASEIAHEDAIRLTMARILTSPTFLYKRELPPPGDDAAPVSDMELASRLSYFLWSSSPDEPLRRLAGAGSLQNEETLKAQLARMLPHPRTRRLAIQFACQWLHLRNFDTNDEKNEKLYPQFASLRGAMYEETVRFFEDMFRNDGSILGFLDADHTFLNEPLARHYGIPGVRGANWRRVEGVRKHGRGGTLGMASVLSSLSGASRTSPILRGNWVSETLLGERLPRPPANVPQLPDEVPSGLTERQLIEKHSSVPECAKCHKRIDPYGFALEQYDAIGRLRARAVDTRTTLITGQDIRGLAGLRNYLLKDRHDDILRQFCRKLLGFALGRSAQLSDEPLIDRMQTHLKAHDYRFSVAVETIVLSRPFREIRGRLKNEN